MYRPGSTSRTKRPSRVRNARSSSLTMTSNQNPYFRMTQIQLLKNQNEGRRPAAHAAKRGPGLEPGRAAFHLGLRPLPSKDEERRCPGSGFAAPRYPPRHMAPRRLPFRAGKLAGSPFSIRRSGNALEAWTWDSNPLQQDPKSCALPDELVLEKLKGIEPPTSRISGRSTTELQPRLLLTRNTHAAERRRASRVSTSPDTWRRCPVKCSIPAELKRSSLASSSAGRICERLPRARGLRAAIASQTQMG